jgi:threonine/homoserine/homoserine lactone efflux protein
MDQAVVIPAESLLTFFVASLLLGLSPGPDLLYVITQSALYGARAGALVTLGLCTGLLGHTAAVAFGLAALIAASPLAFRALAWCGAAYLLVLAAQAWRASVGSGSATDGVRLSAAALYRRGVVMNLSNPKVTVFFLAFLPQFVEPKLGSSTLQVSVLGGVFILAALLVFNTAAFLSGSLGRLLIVSRRIQTAANRLAAVVFVALALRLAVATG